MVHLIGVDLDNVLINEFGDNFPDNCIVGYKSNGIDAKVVFPQKEGKSWFDLGCISATKVVKSEK